MKKVFLFLAVSTLTLSLNSCSKDDNPTYATLKCKVNGVQKTFITTGMVEYGHVWVTGYIGTPTNKEEMLQFAVRQGQTSQEWVSIQYNEGYPTYMDKNAMTETPDMIITITENNTTTHTLKGSFSGTLTEYGVTEPNQLTISEGTFDVKY